MVGLKVIGLFLGLFYAYSRHIPSNSKEIYQNAIRQQSKPLGHPRPQLQRTDGSASPFLESTPGTIQACYLELNWWGIDPTIFRATDFLQPKGCNTPSHLFEAGWGLFGPKQIHWNPNKPCWFWWILLALEYLLYQPGPPVQYCEIRSFIWQESGEWMSMVGFALL